MITSLQNKSVKSWRKLKQNKERQKTGLYLIEGEHLIEEAVRYAKDQIVQLIVRVDKESLISQNAALKDIPSEIVTEEIAHAISDTPSNQGIFALMEQQSPKMPKELKGAYLCLDGLQDPGNVGTLIRSADACGLTGVVLGSGTVDLYNPKVIRSAQGSHWHLPVYSGDLFGWVHHFKDQSIPVYGSALDEQAKSYKQARSSDHFALIIGNEGSGMQEELLSVCDDILYIPIKGGAESLNAAIAGSILMFHLFDQE